MKADGGRRRKKQPAGALVGFDRRSLSRLRSPPDGERCLRARQSIGIAFEGWAATVLTPGSPATPICGPPHATHSKGCDQVVLIASGMAAHEHLAVLGVGDRQARLAIVMRRAARHPAAARLSPVEGLRNTLS